MSNVILKPKSYVIPRKPSSNGHQRGNILVEQAYAQGKMLEHGGWNGLLPRHITPSDADFIFDNRGNVIFCELSSSCSRWRELSIGQLLLYKSLCYEPTQHHHLSILLSHSVPSSRKIDTRRDIETFQIMLQVGSTVKIVKEVYKRDDGFNFDAVVDLWFSNPKLVKLMYGELPSDCYERPF